jgi:hypothetical protein
MIAETLILNPIIMAKIICEHDIIKQNHLDTLINLPYMDNNIASGGVFVSKSKNILESEKLSEIKKDFMLAAKKYTSDVLRINNEFKMTNSWLTKNEKGLKHHDHIHPNVIFSAVTYFYDDLSNDSFDEIVWQLPGLWNNFKNFNFNYEIVEWNAYNSQMWNIRPNKNEIFIFPGCITHGSNPNLSEKPRYCIGANFFVTGIVGSDDGIDKVIIN